MRKNKIKNAQIRRSINKVKKDVTSTFKAIEKHKNSIRSEIPFLILLVLWNVLMLSATYKDLNFNYWIDKTITYQSYYYVPRTYSVKGASRSAYYVIVDTNNQEYRIPWDDEFDIETFNNDVQVGDAINITYYRWIVGKVIVSISTDNVTYRSLEDAKDVARANAKVDIILSLVSVPFLILCIVLIVGHLKEIKVLRVKLIEYQSKYDEYVQNIT